METIRESQIELKFYKKVVGMLLKREEISKLKSKSKYDDDDWRVPPFVLRGKEMTLPKVNGKSIM